jgi:periplasmic protein TonB
MAIRHWLVLGGLLGLLAMAQAQNEQPTAPARLRVSSGVAESLKIHDVPPKYPKEALEKGLEGDVILQAMIDRKGNIASLKVAKGDPILAEAAMEAVKKWKYRPYVLNGEPVEVLTTIKIQFHM